MINYKGDELSTEAYAEIRLQEVLSDIIGELTYNYPDEDTYDDEEKAEKLVEKVFDEYVWF